MANEMLCPVDRTPLVMSERQNIEIDYCPTCRGVWLDRGELDKIIERSASTTAPAPQAPPPSQSMGHAPQPFGQSYGYSHKKRRKSFLEELFD
ncbi:MAG TPA: zf-TFIIB domain-containing protein [Allosphingosinicella sp.]|uniref:TFIIB-type zinc ribbon-containing protein n=1 Tax=Allosphingosinicella sp. TaxID=2823234 RepID=UPI002EDB222B